MRLLGIDPGRMTGLAIGVLENGGIRWAGSVTEAEPAGVLEQIRALNPDRVLAERYVLTTRSATANDPAAQRAALAITEGVAAMSHGRTIPAGRTKPFATDKRLKAAGWLAARPSGGIGRHATDAARVVCFWAISTGLLLDPLAT